VNDAADTFDPTEAVAAYRRVVTQRDAARDELAKTEFDRIAQRLRDSWKEWQGEDSLHEMAFGEPE
jgi:hypothetical protein